MRVISGLLLLGCIGCVPVLKLMYGIKKPSPKSPEELASYLEKHELGTDNWYYLTEAGWLAAGEQDRLHSELQVFNAEGRYLDFRPAGDSTSCGAKAYALMRTLKYDLPRPYSDRYRLADEIAGAVDPTGKPLTVADLPPADYYAVQRWATFMGKVNKNTLLDVQDIIARDTVNRIVLLKLNIDLIDSYSPELLEAIANAK